ncbi:MAG: ABC transporter permease subunit, partial [Chloroflexota bacterium]
MYAAATLLLIIFLSFFGLEMARGTMASDAATFGLTSTIDYIGRLIRWDLGSAYAAGFGSRRLEIVDILSQTLPNSLGLLAISLSGAAIVGIALGVAAASQRGIFKFLSLPIILTSLVGISLPTFFIALLLQIGVIRITRFTGQTFIPVGGFGWDDHLILPALVLATRPIAQIARITNVTLSNIWREDYVRTANSKGLGSDLLWIRHIWPNSAIPILTTIGTSIRFSLSSLPVVELYFGWTGIGLVLLRAIARQDDLLTVALALSLGAIFIITNFALEASYRLLDPRLREANNRSGTAQSLGQNLRDLFSGFIDTVRNWPLVQRWLMPKTGADLQTEALFRPKLKESKREEQDKHIRQARLKTWLRATLGSLPFVVGSILLVGLIIIFVAGPALSPANPYNTKGISKIEGVITVPPFPPSPVYPWGSDALGRDMQSLVLSGAQQTLTLILFVMLARLFVGFVLGTLAGWQQDRLLDKAIMSLNEIFAALPTLVFAMILILALGIRRGIWVFVVALCFVGWGEMMQFVRSEVIVIRKQLFVESATALGSRLSGIIMRHMLPNLLPALISLAALEMGAIAMLLGELGFIGIFIGGGTFAEVDIGGQPYHYSDVPEWGALLSNVRAYARGYPWTAFTPAAAFFVAILAFNLFGEGLRRLVQDVGLSFNRFFNRYTLAIVIVILFGLRWIENNTGSTVFLRQQANLVTEAGVATYFNTLTDPQMESRALSTQGAEKAADYIAAKFQEYGLHPAGKKSTYFFDVKRDYFTLSEAPYLKTGGQN